MSSINCTDNLNSSDGSVCVESNNTVNKELKNIGKRKLNINSDQSSCTNSPKATSNDSMRAESLNAILDIYDDLDLCNQIHNFYRLIDLCKDTGSVGFCKLKFDNRDSKEDELSLPSSLPPAMPIESCNNQSFITSYVVETKETHKSSGHASEFLNEIRNYNLGIDSSVSLAELIDLAEFLSIESDIIKAYKDEMEMTRY
ncbi:12597_t:CDS:2 [Acaulospora morrowiae]|uniref:12597_t:CDS:1 n=1 Tax=Acaulospora morrowiae TaxID=94023 RepID=A0A9N8YWP9_9GLOM|nr:12597_t:CDS:2 [Acaulospora morrowiae]